MSTYGPALECQMTFYLWHRLYGNKQTSLYVSYIREYHKPMLRKLEMLPLVHNTRRNRKHSTKLPPQMFRTIFASPRSAATNINSQSRGRVVAREHSFNPGKSILLLVYTGTVNSMACDSIYIGISLPRSLTRWKIFI